MIAIINYGGNVASLVFALERIGSKVKVTVEANEILNADHVILPGVGAAKPAMQQLEKLQLIETINALTQPVLGICLGMQLLYDFSSEGDVNCLKIIPGNVDKLAPKSALPVPHMGWNKVKVITDIPLLHNINDSYMYYVHSFAASITKHSCAMADYQQEFCAVVQKNNFLGVQFHPERSGKIGELMLTNFVKLY